MKKLLSLVSMLIMAVMLTGCGQRVTIAPNEVGQIMTPSGYNGNIIETSTFRLDFCGLPGQICDKLVTLDKSDQEVTEDLKLFMPQDKLKMDFSVKLVLAVNPDQYQLLFTKVPATKDSTGYMIPLSKAYRTYAQQVILKVSREVMAQYKIEEIAANREAVGAQLANRLIDEVREQTPFIVRNASLADVKYPDLITNAQEKAAERREQIATEEAETQKRMIALDREYQETVKQRKIDVEKAAADAEINAIISKSMTKEYVQYKQLEVMSKLAESDNKVFIPTGMLDSIAAQNMISK